MGISVGGGVESAETAVGALVIELGVGSGVGSGVGDVDTSGVEFGSVG